MNDIASEVAPVQLPKLFGLCLAEIISCEASEALHAATTTDVTEWTYPDSQNPETKTRDSYSDTDEK